MSYGAADDESHITLTITLSLTNDIPQDWFTCEGICGCVCVTITDSLTDTSMRRNNTTMWVGGWVGR